MSRGTAGALAVLTLVVGAACGSSGHRTGPDDARSTSPALSGHLTVLAAASLTEALTDDRTRLRVPDRALDISFSFGGSPQLAAQVESGAPADVIATADEPTMQRLVAANKVEAPVDIATNRLAIVVVPGNPLGIGGLADLARPRTVLVVADPAVPAGRYAAQALSKAGVDARPVSRELDVKAVVQKVALREADAGIVYVTDVTAAGSSVQGVAIPAAQNVLAHYPIAVVRGTPHRRAALAFVQQLLRGAGQDALAARGFGPP